MLKLNIQRFAEEDIDENIDEETENESPEEEKETVQSETKKSDNKSFVKIREQKAREKLLEELGVKDIEEAKSKISAGETALAKIAKIEKQLEDRDKASIVTDKVTKLTKLLENEKVFDADALISYIDIDKIEYDNDGSIKDSNEIINQLKKIKPNFFGKEFIKTDKFNKTEGNNTIDPYKENYENKNYVGVISTYLKNNKK